MTDIALILLIAAKVGFAALMVAKHVAKVIAKMMEQQEEFSKKHITESNKLNGILVQELSLLRKELNDIKKANAISELPKL